MEIERLKDLRVQREREEKKVQAAHEGAKMLIDQITERNLERIKQDEIYRLEKAQLTKNIEEMKAAEQKKLQEKREKARLLMLEVAASNKESIKIKQKKIEQEQALMAEIVAYNLQKAA